MGDSSKIEWTDATWNPVTGCSKVSPGCAHCYAETLALTRLAGKPGYPGLPWTPENAEQNVVVRPDRLDQPLRWRRPRMVFVNSMSDLFHEQLPWRFIAEVFAVMSMADQHVFQVLTKRPQIMRNLLTWPMFWLHLNATRLRYGREVLPGGMTDTWPTGDRTLPNVWLGTSIENRRYVQRADLLRETPAAVRFISAEPLLGPLVHERNEHGSFRCLGVDRERGEYTAWVGGYDGPQLDLTGIDWLIVGGESGPKHRPMRAEWVRDLKRACLAQAPCDCRPGMDGGGVYHQLDCRSRERRTAFFFKQWGGAKPTSRGRELDGRTWDEMPSRIAA